MTGHFYEPLGDGRYRATPLTGGPWDPRFQHGGPPAALLVHGLERVDPVEGCGLTRVTAEFLGPVPIGELTLAGRTVRGGRRIQLVEAELTADGKPVMRALGWRVRRGEQPGLEPVETAVPMAFGGRQVGGPIAVDFPYAHALEWRIAAGDSHGPGPATVWTRLTAEVVAGEQSSPVQRVVAAADSGNGLSAVLDWTAWTFLNVELTVHLARPPRGEWVCVDAGTQISPDGVGLATSTLYDREGRIGAGAQSLLVAPR